MRWEVTCCREFMSLLCTLKSLRTTSLCPCDAGGSNSGRPFMCSQCRRKSLNMRSVVTPGGESILPLLRRRSLGAASLCACCGLAMQFEVTVGRLLMCSQCGSRSLDPARALNPGPSGLRSYRERVATDFRLHQGAAPSDLGPHSDNINSGPEVTTVGIWRA